MSKITQLMVKVAWDDADDYKEENDEDGYLILRLIDRLRQRHTNMKSSWTLRIAILGKIHFRHRISHYLLEKKLNKYLKSYSPYTP